METWTEPPQIEKKRTEEWLLLYSYVVPASISLYAATKRASDILLSLALLILLSPIILLISILIVFDSPGAPIFKQIRKGKDQHPFFIYKFRTMHKDAGLLQDQLRRRNEADGILFKLKQDPRITAIGRFLRAYSIDELPQLANVLKGDMSLVGPRPFSLDDFSQTPHDPDAFERWVSERHQVRPGLTGLWQVSGRNDVAFETLMELDLLYVRYWNPIVDALILGKTIGVVLNKKGAY